MNWWIKDLYVWAGAKFGGYGSFLPVQQRSPVRSHTKTPSKIPNTTTSTSPNNLHLEVYIYYITICWT